MGTPHAAPSVLTNTFRWPISSLTERRQRRTYHGRPCPEECVVVSLNFLAARFDGCNECIPETPKSLAISTPRFDLGAPRTYERDSKGTDLPCRISESNQRLRIPY